MDKKIYAVIAVVIIIVAAAAAAVVLTKNNDSEGSMKITTIAQVNTEGSGMFAKEGLDLATTDENGKVTFHDKNWDQIIVLTPGPSSIQHVQLQQLVTQTLKTEDGKNYGFVKYDVTTQRTSGNVYWVPMSTAGMINDYTSNTIYDAGFIWEPVYSQALEQTVRPSESVFLTNDLWPDHACCVVGANTSWINSHSDEATAFLAGYMKAVDFINNAKANAPETLPTIEKTMSKEQVLAMGDYAYVVWLGMNKCNMEQEVVEEALTNVTYTYSSSGTNLDTLTGQVQELVESFVAMGTSVVNKPISATGATDARDFAEKFVDDQYLQAAGSFDKQVNSSISVAVISGDIHQLAIHLAVDMNYFNEYGLTVNIQTGTNGAGVANLLLSNEVNLGFLGAPPASIYTINFA